MSGEIVDLSRAAPPSNRTVDVCVIGSGCGGGTAARVLAEAGLEVVVLEEGPDKTGPALTQRGPEMYDQLYMDRGGRATEDLAINVMQGRALGGGGVINACDVVPIPEGVLAHWRTRWNLSELTDAALRPYKEQALTDLSANPIPPDELNGSNQILRAGTEALGWRGEIMMHNRVGCQGLGTCMIGCPVNAKKNPRFVSIPAAIDAGATFYTRARAVRIDDAGAELKTVVARTLDERGYHERKEFRLRARRVIVAANAIATPQLLLRSGIGNQHVGRNLTLQPQLPIVSLFDDDVMAHLGIPQAWAVTEFEVEDDPEHGLWGFRIEPVMGTPGIVATLLPYIGNRNMELMESYTKIAGSLLLAPDDPSGRVELRDDGRPIIYYDHRENHRQRLREAARAAAQIYFEAGARLVMVPSVPPVVVERGDSLDVFDDIPFGPAQAPLISAHQQSTVRMAPDAEAGGADPDGQVFGTREVYVMDTSVFPTSSSSHTMTPTITMARYLADKLVARAT